MLRGSAATGGNDAIRQMLSGRGAQRLNDLTASGPAQGRTKEDRKQARQQYVSDVMDAAAEMAQSAGSSDESWRTFMRAYAQAPDYSILNMLTARAQLRRKEVEEPGLLFSQTAWKSLGRQIKPEFRQPTKDEIEAGRDRKDWDAKYLAAMTSPSRYPHKTGEFDAEGNEKIEMRIAYGRFNTFNVFHQDATEAIGGGDPPPIPKAPWADATGSSEDAKQLMEDLKRICQYENVTVQYGELKQPRTDNQGVALGNVNHAQYDPSTKTITVDATQSEVEQAVATLRAVCEHVGRAPNDRHREDADALNEVAAESAKFVIASLYGLDSDAQTFPQLARFTENKNKMRGLTGEVDHRVGKILNYLDPRRQAKAEGNQDLEKRRMEQRAAARAAKENTAA